MNLGSFGFCAQKAGITGMQDDTPFILSSLPVSGPRCISHLSPILHCKCSQKAISVQRATPYIFIHFLLLKCKSQKIQTVPGKTRGKRKKCQKGPQKSIHHKPVSCLAAARTKEDFNSPIAVRETVFHNSHGLNGGFVN